MSEEKLIEIEAFLERHRIMVENRLSKTEGNEYTMNLGAIGVVSTLLHRFFKKGEGD